MNEFAQDKCVSVEHCIHWHSRWHWGLMNFADETHRNKTQQTQLWPSKREWDGAKKQKELRTCVPLHMFSTEFIPLPFNSSRCCAPHCATFCVCSACKLNEDIERHILFNVNRIYGILIKNNKTYDCKRNKCTVTGRKKHSKWVQSAAMLVAIFFILWAHTQNDR